MEVDFYRQGVSDFIVLSESSSQNTPLVKKLGIFIWGRKVFKHDKDFPIVKDSEREKHICKT